MNTDEGITGIGSCYTSRALVEASLQLLHPMLIGETGLEAERVAEKLRQMTFWQGRGGAVEHTISGIDIALWDLQGQALGQPVSRLLGGNYRDRIKPYASILSRTRRSSGTAPRADRARLPGDQDGVAPVRPGEPEARRAPDQDRA